MDVSSLPTLLGAAWLMPLAACALIVFFGPKMGHHGKAAGYVSVGAIVTSCVLSFVAMFGVWLPNHPLADASHHGAGHGEGEHPLDGDGDHDGAADHTTRVNERVPLLARPAVEGGYMLHTAGQASSGTMVGPHS